MKLSEALELSRSYLFRPDNTGGVFYICHAVLMAHKDAKFSERVGDEVRKKIYRAIPDSCTLISFLDNTRQLPRETYEDALGSFRGYDLTHLKYLEKRDEFIDKLIATLKKEEQLGIS